MIKIDTKGDWTITGPAWVTNLTSGSGPYEYYPSCTPNTTGEYRSETITVTIHESTYKTSTENTITIPGEVLTVPIVQYASDTFINGKIYILGLDEDAGYNVHYYVSANENESESSYITCGESVDISGYKQTGIIPKNGGTVAVRAYNPGEAADEIKPFLDALNNKIFWKASETPLEADEVVSTGAEVSLVYNGAEKYWHGEFTATYGTNSAYFYIVFDYRNSVECSGSWVPMVLEHSKYPINTKINYTTDIGPALVAYAPDTRDSDMAVYYNGSLVLGGSSNDEYWFVKYSDTVNEALMTITDSQYILGDISISIGCPSLTSFSLYNDPQASPSLSCSSVTSLLPMYHNGLGTYPEIGDIVYDAATPLDGGNSYYKVYVENTTIQIDSNGVVIYKSSCACSESEVPAVIDTAVTYSLGETPYIKLSATNNPTSWRATSDLHSYTIYGGANGGGYTYTDSVGLELTDVVSIDTYVSLISPSAPDCSSTVTYVDNGVVADESFSIDNSGVLSINIQSSGTYYLHVIATNCVGDSDTMTITVTINSPVILLPFKMSDEGYNSAEEACAASPCMATFWYDNGGHTTFRTTPEVNDIVYIDGYKKDFFNGGYLYYKGEGFSYLIDGIGQIKEKTIC